MANHSSIRAWEISWTEESGGLQSTTERLQHHPGVLQDLHLVLPTPTSVAPIGNDLDSHSCTLVHLTSISTQQFHKLHPCLH